MGLTPEAPLLGEATRRIAPASSAAQETPAARPPGGYTTSANRSTGVSRRLGRALLHSALAALCACAVVFLASSAMMLTTAPRAASLSFEPFSLLLLPGLVLAMLAANPHDYSPRFVLAASALLYFVLFQLLFWRLRRRRS